MRQNMKNAPKLAGVVGFPIEQSLSPLIHTVWAAREAVSGHYLPIAAPPGYDAFARCMDALQRVGFEGVNVTIPHKENALHYAASASARAKRAGAANMVTFGAGGAHADNSDIEGFTAALDCVTVPVAQRRHALLLGAGGAARGVAVALAEAGYGRITIANRSRERAVALANDLGGDLGDGLADLAVVAWDSRERLLGEVDLVVNTTSLGMAGQPPLALDLAAVKPGAIIADIVYAPVRTALLENAAARGLRTVDGLSMLMHQAAPGYRQWLGGKACIDDDLRAQVMAEIERRKTRSAQQ